jgi:RNA-dependent RNA polymerase
VYVTVGYSTATPTMEIQLKRISHDADKYDVRKSVELVLHGPLYDPNDRDYKGRKPRFEVKMGESPAGRLHDGTAILYVPRKLGQKLLRWNRESEDQNIIVCGKPLRVYNNHQHAPWEVNQRLERARYIDPDQDRKYDQKKDYCSQVRLRVATIQVGVWYRDPNAPQKQRRSFSVEYEREFLRQSAAYINVVYEHGEICIDVSATLSLDAHTTEVRPTQIGQRETEEDNFLILIKFTRIRKLGIGYDEFGQACA